jgi:DUF4097 and DUF4098 domain-containing protein YvlB
MLKGIRVTTALAVVSLSAATALAASEGRFERTLQVGAPASVSVVAGSGDITVSRGAAGVVVVRGRITANERRAGSDAEAAIRQVEQQPPIAQQGNAIIIGKIEDEAIAKTVSVDYEVTVPEATDLTARSGSGDVVARGVGRDVNLASGSGSITAEDVGGALSATTGSGDVSVDRVRGQVRVKSGSGSVRATGAGDAVSAGTGSGDVRVDVTGTGEVSASSESGDVAISGVRGALRARSSSGDVTVDGTPTAAWEVRSSSGDIVLTLPGTAAFRLDANTSSGRIDSKASVTVQGELPKGTLRGDVRGGGSLVSVSTNSGDITIK